MLKKLIFQNSVLLLLFFLNPKTFDYTAKILTRKFKILHNENGLNDKYTCLRTVFHTVDIHPHTHTLFTQRLSWSCYTLMLARQLGATDDAVSCPRTLWWTLKLRFNVVKLYNYDIKSLFYVKVVILQRSIFYAMQKSDFQNSQF